MNLSSFEISTSALEAQRLRMELAAHNVANSQTPGFRRLKAVLEEQAIPSFEELLAGKVGGGVRVVAIRAEEVPSVLRFDPGNPQADSRGFVSVPQANPAVEMVELMSAARAYEANLAAVEALRSMAVHAMEIGR